MCWRERWDRTREINCQCVGRERWDRTREINCQCVGERDGTERDKLSVCVLEREMDRDKLPVCGRERWDRTREINCQCVGERDGTELER